MRGGLTCVVATLLLTAGCIGGDEEGEAIDPASVEEAETTSEVNTTTRELYSQSAIFIGVGAPHPTEDGALVGPLGPSVTETFEVGPEVLDLDFEAELGGGTGSSRIEVYGPDGALVFASEQLTCAGAPGVGGACLVTPEGGDEDVVEGTYEVHYYSMGAMQLGLTVDAEVPQTPADRTEEA